MIKKLVGSVREYKKQSLLAPVMIIAEVILDCMIPLVMAKLIDSVLSGQGMRAVFFYGGILLGAAFLSLFFGIMAGHYAAVASTGFARNLRKDMYCKIQDFSFETIDKFSHAGLVTRLTVDVANVQSAYMMLIRMAVRAPLMIVFSVITAVGISAKMACIFLVTVPLLGLSLFFIIRKAFPIFREAFNRYDAFNGTIQENVKGMRVVKAYAREDFEAEKFEKETEELRKVFGKAETIVRMSEPIMQFCVYLTVLAIIGIGSYFIIDTFGGFDFSGAAVWGELSTGGLAGLITYTMQILISLMMFAMIGVMIVMSAESARRIGEVLCEESTIKSPEKGVKEVKDGEIVFENVSFKYSQKAERNTLENINLTIPSGTTMGIIGGTGSGKTSLVQLIPRLYDVACGNVKVGGVDVRDYEPKVLRDAVAMVLQKNTLFSGSVRENMQWGNKDAIDEEISRALRLAQAEEFVMNMPNGYDSRIEEGGSNLSGGQRQRLCIARAILKNPKVLILDDSSSAVDMATDRKLRKAFSDELEGVTKIIIAQRVASVMDADRIIVLDDGKISAIGTHSELIETSDIYREVYESQIRSKGVDNAEI